jgi:hypothetical protein
MASYNLQVAFSQCSGYELYGLIILNRDALEWRCSSLSCNATFCQISFVQRREVQCVEFSLRKGIAGMFSLWKDS